MEEGCEKTNTPLRRTGRRLALSAAASVAGVNGPDSPASELADAFKNTRPGSFLNREGPRGTQSAERKKQK